MKQYIIGALIGAVVLFIVLKVIAKKPKNTESKTMENILEIAKTDEAKNLITSDEFRAVMKTPAFQNFATDFGLEQLANFIQV